MNTQTLAQLDLLDSCLLLKAEKPYINTGVSAFDRYANGCVMQSNNNGFKEVGYIKHTYARPCAN